MAVDFSSLLKKPAGKALKPMTLPIGDYQGIIKSREFGESAQKKTPRLTLTIGFIDWPDSIPAEERGQLDDQGAFHQLDLSKRSMRKDIYLTEDSMYRLDDLLKSCGIGADGRSYEELIEELIGKYVIVEMQQSPGRDDPSELYNQLGKIMGTGQ